MPKDEVPTKPSLFIGSSTAALPVAIGLAHHLDAVAKAATWDGAFDLSQTTIEDLERNLEESDFGVIILAADDQQVTEEGTVSVPRDNVIFELGMFVGRLGRQRSFIVVPKDRNLKLPTDLLGITQARYDPEWAATDANKALSVAAGDIRLKVIELGTRRREGAPLMPVREQHSDASDTPFPLGGGDGWRFYADIGVLPELSDSEVREGRWVTHPLHGLGQIVGFDPPGAADLSVSVRFRTGIARILLSQRSLFRADPRN